VHILYFSRQINSAAAAAREYGNYHAVVVYSASIAAGPEPTGFAILISNLRTETDANDMKKLLQQWCRCSNKTIAASRLIRAVLYI